MIVVETSAVLCILYREPEAEAFLDILARSECSGIPVSCFVEAAMNLRRNGLAAAMLLDLIRAAGMELLAADERQAHLAAEADRRFGRATGHPARLNFGDCLAYAAAIAHDAPLLFKGGDFGHTDVKRAA